MTQDPSLHDEQLETEIRLVGDLVLAASQCQGHLSQEAIDEALGVRGPPAGAAGPTPSDGPEQSAGSRGGEADPRRG